jgi:hypothetical protein
LGSADVPLRIPDPVEGRETQITAVVRIRQFLLLPDCRRCVHPDAVDAAVEPEPQDAVEFDQNIVIAPIQVRLFDCEGMQIPLARQPVFLDDPFPSGATTTADPVIRRGVSGTVPKR